jgi:hypothetical protein
MRSKLGTVVHQVTSDEGTCTFRATEHWEATEIAPGGYEGAKEAIPESMYRKHRGAFKRGAVFRSFLEQTGECIFGGEIPDDPTVNDGRLDIAVDGWAKRLEQKAGRLLYKSDDLGEWVKHKGRLSGGPRKWEADLDSDYSHGPFALDGPYLGFKRHHFNIIDEGAYGTAGWQAANVEGYGEAFQFATPGFSGLTRLKFKAYGVGHSSFSVNGRSPGCHLKVWALSDEGGAYLMDVFWYGISGAGDGLEVDVLLTGPSINYGFPGPSHDCMMIRLEVGDIYQGILEMFAKYGVPPDAAYSPNGVANQYDSWTNPMQLVVYDVEVFGISTDSDMSVSAGVRDIASRAGVRDSQVTEFGFNMLPLDFRNGESYAECLAYLGMLVGARALMLDTGTRPYLEFDRPSKRVWTPDRHQRVDTWALRRYDRASFPWRSTNGHSHGWTQVVAETPFEKPRSYGRIQMTDRFPSEERLAVVGGQVVEQLVKHRLGGDFDITYVTDDDGAIRSGYLVHAGDMMKNKEGSGRGAIARKTMTIRGVSGQLETNLLSLDRLLEHEAKRMQRAS